MKKSERIIITMMLFVISLSNVATPVSYAAELGKFHYKVPTSIPGDLSSMAPLSPILQPDQGSVLGAATSLLTAGNPQPDFDDSNSNSAFQRIPIRMEQLAKQVYRTDEDVELAVLNPDNEPFTTTVQDATGETVNVPITETNNGTTTTVDLASSNVITPGRYTVRITGQDGQSTEQNFTWGVLAMNFDKSLYHPGDTGDIAMAVLNNSGGMVCDAQVTLQISNQQAGISDTLATQGYQTADKQITVNPQCQEHDFSLQPDYEAHYQFAKPGIYTMQLTAVTTDGSQTITDSIQVTDKIPFDVQRVSATRLYPPNTYPMIFNIKANQDFTGTVTETVPDSFTITPATQSASQSYTDMQTVYLDGNDPAANLQQAIIASDSAGLVMPFQGNYPITQGFGAQMTDPSLQSFYTSYGLAGHDGIDFGVPMYTPLYAVDNGTVIWSGPGDYGNTIIIQHGWGESYYGHLSSEIVTVGQSVSKGELIGYSGDSGQVTGPHLHFGMKPNNADMTNGYYGKIDPLPFLPFGHEPQSLSTLGPTNTLAIQTTPQNVVNGQSVLGASDSASPSPTIVPTGIPTTETTQTPTPAPTNPTPSATPSGALTETPVPSTSTPTITPTATPTPESNLEQAEMASPAANENFSVLDKEILANEQLAANAQTEKVKVITWQISLKKGDSTSLGYMYQTPDVSPQFYLLGPVKFYEKGSNKVVFQEQRQWEIANDDVGTEWLNSTSAPQIWNGHSWKYRKKIIIDHTKVNTAQYFNRPRVLFMDAGTDSTHDLSFYNGPKNSGPSSSNCSVSLTPGGCSLEVQDTTQNSSISAPTGTITTAGRLSFYVNFGTLQNTGVDSFFNMQRDGTYAATPIALSSGGVLECNNGAGNAGTSVLKAGYWYRISFGYTVSGVNLTSNIYLNGKLEVNCGTYAMSTTAPDFFYLGSNVVNQNIYFDDIYDDTGTGNTDTGDVHVTAKLPIAQGQGNSFTPTGTAGGTTCTDGSTNCEYVNERPTNAADELQATSAVSQNFAIQASSSGDVDISQATYLSDEAWVLANNSTGGCTADITNNGVNTPITLTNANAVYTNAATISAYPTASNAIGMVACAGNTTNFTEGGLMIAYIPATSGVINNNNPTFMEDGSASTNEITTATGGLYASENTSAGSTVTSDSTTPTESGPTSIQFLSGSSGSVATVNTPTGVLSDGGGRITAYFRLGSDPTGNMTIMNIENTGGTSLFALKVTSTGALQLYQNTPTQIGSNGAALSTGTWYRISISYVITNTTVYRVRVYVNGVISITGNNGATLGATGSSQVVLGWGTPGVGNGLQLNMEDVYIDEGNDLSDPGNIHVTAKLPVADGASAGGYTPNGTLGAYTNCTDGSTNCEYINDRPLRATSNLEAATANAQETFGDQSISQGDINIASGGALAVEGWVDAKNTGACTGDIILNGTATNIPLTTTTTVFSTIGANFNFLSATQSAIGIQNCATGTVSLYGGGLMVAYLANNPGNSLTNYPVLIDDPNDTDLSTTNEPGGTGSDIAFTDSMGKNLLNSEVMSFSNSATNGSLWAWVQIPQLLDYTDTIIYMYYDNPTQTTNTSVASSTYDSNYAGVWHLDTSPASNEADSTANGNNGMPEGSMSGTNLINGEFNKALSFNGTSQYINAGTGPSLNPSGDNYWTVELWYLDNNSGANDTGLVDKTQPATGGYEINEDETCNKANYEATRTSDPNAEGNICIGSNPENASWQDLAITYTPQGNYVYLNGVQSNPLDTGQTDYFANTVNATLLAAENGSPAADFLNGDEQEVRISNYYRTPGWFTTSYNMESSPGTVIKSIGSVETKTDTPGVNQLLRNGEWFSSKGVDQPFMY